MRVNQRYPYPFLNPANVGGYGGVLVYSLGIIALFLVVSWILIYIGQQTQTKCDLIEGPGRLARCVWLWRDSMLLK
jgi:hypothetical protein